MPDRVYTQVFAVASGLIERDGKFLLIQENLPGHPDDKKWNLPGGWIEIDEDPQESVCREVLEETGFVFTPTGIVGVYSIAKDWSARSQGVLQAIKIIYCGTLGNEAHALLGDTSGFAWYTPQEIHAMDAHTLRDLDIPTIIADYQQRHPLPLDIVRHSRQK